ncbi:hypothetical protein M3223_05245 [Paenibacillus pasadenensis]|nr:hypothetical protein [Paenibacillus pasadenensis]
MTAIALIVADRSWKITLAAVPAKGSGTPNKNRPLRRLTLEEDGLG